jgi:hypothetical protein
MNAYGGDEQTMPQQEEERLNKLFHCCASQGNRFYVLQTNQHPRRILRRMALNKNENPSAYLKYLREINRAGCLSD